MKIVYFDGLDNIVGKELCNGNGMSYYCAWVSDYSPFLGLALIKVLPNHKIAPISYEVWIIRKESSKNSKSKLRFPSNEDFGRYGWSYATEEAARFKIQELTKDVMGGGL